jgi:hypothetical protein
MGTAMVVNENVVIEQPYLVEDCRLLAPSKPGAEDNTGSNGGKGSSADQALLRIKKVLGMEREKLALRRGLGTGGLGVGKPRGGVAGVGAAWGERKGG